MCFNVDGQLASELIIGAVGQENWEVEIKGKASHAGVAPEKGISATLVGAIALGRGAAAPAGSARSSSPTGTAPAMSASSAARTASPPATRPTSSPTTPSSRARRAAPRPPSRPRSPRATEDAFAKAQAEVKDHEGETAEGEVQPEAVLPAVQARRERAGREARHQGARSCWASSRPICSPTAGSTPTGSTSTAFRPITIGAGQAEIHTIKEYVNLAEFEKGCRLGVLHGDARGLACGLTALRAVSLDACRDCVGDRRRRRHRYRGGSCARSGRDGQLGASD